MNPPSSDPNQPPQTPPPIPTGRSIPIAPAIPQGPLIMGRPPIDRWHQVARASWIAPLIGFGVQHFADAGSKGSSDRTIAFTASLIGSGFVVVGMIQAIIALVGVIA